MHTTTCSKSAPRPPPPECPANLSKRAALKRSHPSRYVKGYMQSGEGRLPAFYSRTACFKFLFYGAAAGMACSFADSIGAIAALKAAIA
jgi:hypothetical protein